MRAAATWEDDVLAVVKFLLGMLGTAAVLAFAGVAGSAELEARTSSAAGVTIKVTPKRVGKGASTWEFAVVFDTHSQDLNDDPLRNSVLIDSRGARYAPLAWDGPGPGGHHREGTLRFDAPAPRPDAIDLQIRRPGESAPRNFRWSLK
ncbi:MAG: hypothetical protein AB7O31_09290 [Burkholderiales bacterium]